MNVTMGLCGVTDVAGIGPHIIASTPIAPPKR